MPDGSMMKPDPSEFTRRGPRSRFCGSPWPRRLKKSLNSSSSCGSLGSCGSGELRVSTFCEVEILTTASIRASAAHQPNEYDTEHSRCDPRDPQRVFRTLQRACRQALCRARERGEQQPFDDEHETDRGDELGHLA